MKFCYCPECKKIHPKNWYSRDKCEICKGECKTFVVKRTIYGWLMYVFSLLGVVVLVLYVGHFQMGWEAFGIMKSVPSDLAVVILFGSILASFVFQYLELSKTSEIAERISRSKDFRS